MNFSWICNLSDLLLMVLRKQCTQASFWLMSTKALLVPMNLLTRMTNAAFISLTIYVFIIT